jgi:dihydropteroate synthase
MTAQHLRTPLVKGLPELGRCRVMGVLNVTPDSFSDGGLWFDHDGAVAHGLAMAAHGADLVDVGGESTRPGADRIPREEELRRVVPVVHELAAAGVATSVDTMRAAVAEAALDAGAVLVNDVSGGQGDPAMLPLVAERRVPYVLMHWREFSRSMQERAVYTDVVAEVRSELSRRLELALRAGVDLERVVLDPGIGFAKTAEHNWTLLRNLPALASLGRPLLVGTSRKAFLGRLLADGSGVPRPPAGRDDATTATTALLAGAGVWAVRVHDVASSADAVRVAAALTAGGTTGGTAGGTTGAYP